MERVAVEQVVEPQPGPARAIGSLNIVFGCFLFLMGLLYLSWIGPSFAANRPFRLEQGDAQNLYDQMHAELVRQFHAREAAATTTDEKGKVREERIAFEAGHQTDLERRLDLPAINRDLLWISWYSWADFVTGPVLNLLMLAAGIGLTQLRIWARKLAVWVAVLKIVRLILLTAIFVVVVVPHTGRAMKAIAPTKLGAAIVAQLNADHAARTGGTAVRLNTRDFVPGVTAIAYAGAILGLMLGLIYPVVTLVVLTRPGVKAACSLLEDSISDADGDDS
jgi:hypothetical protein